MTAIKATLHSYKSLATRKQLQITLEVPQEYAADALKMVGVADPSGTQWFALTRIQDAPLGATESGPDESGLLGVNPCDDAPTFSPHADPAKIQDSRRAFSSLPRSQQAALKLHDQHFRLWLNNTFTRVWSHHWNGSEDATADAVLKELIGIKSKTELDIEGPTALAFDRLLTDFSVRGIVR